MTSKLRKLWQEQFTYEKVFARLIFIALLIGGYLVIADTNPAHFSSIQAKGGGIFVWAYVTWLFLCLARKDLLP